MPFCGPGVFVPAGTTVCPANTPWAGKAPSSDANNYKPIVAAPPGESTVTGPPPAYNSDTRDVQIGTEADPDRQQHMVSPYGAMPLSADKQPQRPRTMTVYEGQTYLDDLMGRAATNPDGPAARELQGIVNGLRNLTGSELGTMTSIQTAWNDALKLAASSKKDVFEILTGSLGVDIGLGGTEDTYNGPRTTTSTNQMTDAQIEQMAIGIGMDMIGQAPDQATMAKIKQRVRAGIAANPNVTTTTPDGHNTIVDSSGGFTQADAESVMRNIMSANPQYGDYQKATTLMDWMANAIEARPDV